MRRILRSALLLLSGCALTAVAHADGASPIQIALFNPVQIVKADKPVSGLRLDFIYGKNTDVTGLDWGLVNHDTGSGHAFQWGAFNYVEKDFTGWQDGWVNMTKGEFTGLQWGLFNQSSSLHGVGVGVINVTKNMRGLQVGVVNMTETAHGLQIGIGNIIQKGKIPFLPIVNWSM